MNKADKERLEELLTEVLAIIRKPDSSVNLESGGTGDGPPGGP
jgi:hypothetical protein